MGSGVSQMGHTTTKLACLRPPCPLLNVGAGAPNGLFVPGQASADSYTGTFSEFSEPLNRVHHCAAPLPDGTALLLGGTSTDEPALVFSPCQSIWSAGPECPAL
jgi:hypothetical protein